MNSMVQICIIPKDRIQADELISFLLRSNYLLTTVLTENVTVSSIDGVKDLNHSKKHMITGILRSLQFNTLNEELRKKYTDHMPFLYSVPIIHMDPEQADSIIRYSNNF